FKHFFSDVNLDPERLYEERIIKKGDVYYHHSLVDDNFFASDDYKATLEGYKLFDPDLYRIARLGRFGQLGVKVYTNMYLESHESVMDRVKNTYLRNRYDGIDFGFSVSYNAFVRCAIDRRDNTLFVYECFYNKDLINSELVELLKPLKNSYHMLTADSARPELIEEISRNGIRCYKTKKGKGSVVEGIQKVKSFNKVVISEECKIVYDMMKSWTRKEDKNGQVCEDKFSFDNHFSDAIVYAIESYVPTDLKRGRITVGGI
ncbi:MAG: terminase large subunit, partial [Cetobacterium sp.]